MRPIHLLVALIVAVSLAAPAVAADTTPEIKRFADVDTDRFYGIAVEWAQSIGVVTGVTDRCFAPDRKATRAETAAVLQRLLAPEASATEHPFDDVTAGWQQVPVAWMAATETTTGTAATTFDPSAPATRAMIGAFLWRLEGRPAVGEITHSFTDIRTGWQEDPIEWMWANGITTGRSATIFSPDDAVTRGELLTFVWRWQGHPSAAATYIDPEPVNCGVETQTCAPIFSPAAIAEIDALAAGRRVTAHVHDHRTDCAYELHPGLEITTASLIKAQILAGVLLGAQDRDVAVSAADNARIELMMHFSHNSPPTSSLYGSVGGSSGMERVDGRFGIAGTSHTSVYGATITTAADRTRLVEQLLLGDGPLDEPSVTTAWGWMSAVSVAQSWGVSAGLPANHEYALKNGFYPLSGRGWRLGTTGAVSAPDGDYAFTIMTDGNTTEASGIELVEAVARLINGHLTIGDPVDRPVDDVVCIQMGSGSSWEGAAAELGIIDTALLRHLNGGESRPLSGQRVCAP